MWQVQQICPLAVSPKGSPADGRVYSMKTQSLWTGSAPARLRIVAISPTKSAPGRTASLTTIVPAGKSLSAPRRAEAKTLLGALRGAASGGGIGRRFGLTQP